ncbi:ribosomal RNA small subunit methyltransferase I [Hydrogenophaga crassostreae]|uniref:Ribosomal RNA small subunit methyltransferase I n=1 Tax=Hydrogenophaga crassostreae TaxID=1763535 RepID=A0A167IWP4_9BURK|nr:SAM-dependent methyltransferase [Hydrogenophaga crassostreae]AOW14258.1 ribosomal RNA small subunit methyltransferase I [Hydrogenophaga crassostreae]OAD43719.1 ribosomal RNA small subunit methyltransferase I [Hydrogenophaga crassostreae]
MSAASATPKGLGTLYLVPTPLDFGCLPAGAIAEPLSQWLPGETLSIAARLTHWITENAKSTRAFLKRVDNAQGIAAVISDMQIAELPREAHKKGDHTKTASTDEAARALLGPALKGLDMGLVSEAGMPAIADPGSSIVRAAHALGLPVVALSGPMSLTLALAASGMNGQSFAFVGYVPQNAEERVKRLRELEALTHKTGQTQILIETPYRNAALLQSMLQTLQPVTRLAVSCGIHLPQHIARSAQVVTWKQQNLSQALPLALPSVFLIGR